jgi:hypothetical protein
MRWRIVEVMGDYYYEEIPPEVAIEMIFKEIPKDQEVKNQDDIDRYVERNS